MRNIFFISDTHFHHRKFTAAPGGFVDETGKPVRPFASVEEMNEAIIKNWNDRVRDQDKIYHLGDVTFGNNSLTNSTMSRLRGHKRLLLGNHDDGKDTGLLYWFEKVGIWRIFKEHNFVCSHVPIHAGSFRHVQFNVHGHTHKNLVLLPDGKPDPRYVNVCVEHTNFAPIALEEILAIIKART